MQVKIIEAMRSGKGSEQYAADQVVTVPEAIGATLIVRGAATAYIAQVPEPAPEPTETQVTLTADLVQSVEAKVEQAIESALKGA